MRPIAKSKETAGPKSKHFHANFGYFRQDFGQQIFLKIDQVLPKNVILAQNWATWVTLQKTN